MPATVLVLVETINDYLPILEHQGFHLILAPTPAERAQAIATHGSRIDAVLTRGPLGLTAEEIAALPALKIITVIGAGYEHVDLQAASDRGITVTNGAGVNASSVADHAMAMLLALVQYSLMVGALTLARATRGDALSDEVLEAARSYLAARTPSPADPL